MKPAPFDYAAPTTVRDAVALLQQHRDLGCKVLAGGQTLIPQMNFRQVKPGFLVDLQHVEDLSSITVTENGLVIGAMVRQNDAYESADVAEHAPLLRDGIHHVSAPPVRNNGTVGGSAAYGDPGSEIPAVCVAMDAVMCISGPSGDREVAAADFYTGPFETQVGRDEILTAIRIPLLGGSQAFVEFRRTHLAHAVVGVAVVLHVDDGGTVEAARIALCGVGRTSVRATATEEALVGIKPTDASIEAAVGATVAELSPAGNLHASSETRADIARSYLRQGIEMALDRASNKGDR